MALPHIGWIPYGEGDDVLIWRHDFKSAPTTSNVPFGTVTELGTGTQTFDSEKGMKVGSAGGYTMSNLTGDTTLNNGWQMTFEVERSWLAVAASGGDTIAGNQSAILFGAANLFAVLTTKAMYDGALGLICNNKWLRGAADAGDNYSICQYEGHDDFVTINIGQYGNVNGGMRVIAVDGRICQSGYNGSANSLTTAFDAWSIGHAGGAGMVDHYIRNVQVCKQQPIFPVTPDLSSVLVWGDSLTRNNNDGTAAAPSNYQAMATHRDSEYVMKLERLMMNKGLFPGALNSATYGGHVINVDGTTASLQTYLSDQLSVAPTCGILTAGTNDVGENSNTLSSDFETDLKDYIVDLMVTGTMRKLVIGNVPSRAANPTHDTAAARLSLDQANAIINAIPTWWNTTYPARTGAIIVADRFTAFGGHNPDTSLFDTNDVHPSLAGKIKQAEVMVDALAKVLRT